MLSSSLFDYSGCEIRALIVLQWWNVDSEFLQVWATLLNKDERRSTSSRLKSVTEGDIFLVFGFFLRESFLSERDSEYLLFLTRMSVCP